MPDTKPKVLIVDDVEANLVALEALLDDMGCDLVRAENGNDALKLLLQNEFALMLLDVQMPGMDGFEVARYSREHPVTREVPIIFVTALHETTENTLKGYGTGAVDLLYKPINSRVLRSKVRVFLDLYKSRRALQDEVDAHRLTLSELEMANGALRHFTYAASHDLHAPLRAVQSSLEAIQEDAGDTLGPEPRHYLERSLDASRRMVTLLDALLVYARLQSPGELVELDTNGILTQVQADLADEIRDSNAVVTVGALPPLRGDAGRIYQLFANLVGNALKYRKPDVPPRINVTAELLGREQLFCVTDNGVGIAPEHHDAIFEAFRRLRGNEAQDGTGLGLTICQQIVLQHGGRMTVESALGEGSKFCFALPAPNATGTSA